MKAETGLGRIVLYLKMVNAWPSLCAPQMPLPLLCGLENILGEDILGIAGLWPEASMASCRTLPGCWVTTGSILGVQ
jgi:hypothetical protein